VDREEKERADTCRVEKRKEENRRGCLTRCAPKPDNRDRACAHSSKPQDDRLLEIRRLMLRGLYKTSYGYEIPVTNGRVAIDATTVSSRGYGRMVIMTPAIT